LWMRAPWVSSGLAKARLRNGQWHDCPHVVMTDPDVYLISEQSHDLFLTNIDGQLSRVSASFFRPLVVRLTAKSAT
jgi:hypothetical protein